MWLLRILPWWLNFEECYIFNNWVVKLLSNLIVKLVHLFPDTPTRYNVPSVASISCRICLTDAAQERLIQPCYCKGTIAFVHRTCLENWLNQIGSTFCELCRFNYDVELTHRYSICKSLHIWLKHPRIMTMMRGDLIIGGLVTLVMVTLVTLCFLGSELLFTETMEMGATSK